MNINLKCKYLAIFLLLLCGDCMAQNRIAQFSDSNCSMIHSGEIDHGQILNNDAQTNAAYINCAIGVKISEPDSFEENGRRTSPPDITKFAAHFLQKIDPSFRDQYGNSLLFIVVISFTPP